MSQEAGEEKNSTSQMNELLSLKFDSGLFEAEYSDAVEPAIAAFHSQGGKQSRKPSTPVPVLSFGRDQVTALRLSSSGGDSRIEVPAWPISQSDFTVSAWLCIPLPETPGTGTKKTTMHILSNWTRPWSYMLAIAVDPQGRISLTGLLRRNINSNGSDPNQDLVAVDSTMLHHQANAVRDFPESQGKGFRGVHAKYGKLPGGVPVHVAWVWQRAHRRLSLWANGACVASCDSRWEDQDIQTNPRRMHDVGCKGDSGDQLIQGDLLQLTVHDAAAPDHGGMGSLMRPVGGRMNMLLRRHMILYRIGKRQSWLPDTGV